MKDDGNAVGHGLLEQSEIGNCGGKSIVAEFFSQAIRVRALVLSHQLEPRHDITKQLQLRVVALLNVTERFDDVVGSECPPLRRFERYQQKIRRTKRGVGDERNIRRAIEQNVIVQRRNFAQRIDQRIHQARTFPLRWIGDVELLQREAAGDRIDATEMASSNERLNLRIDGGIEEQFSPRTRQVFTEQCR